MVSVKSQEKADALASELGVKCGKVYSIIANDLGGWWSSSGSNSIQNVGGASDSTDHTLSIGQISVSASLSVSFLIDFTHLSSARYHPRPFPFLETAVPCDVNLAVTVSERVSLRQLAG